MRESARLGRDALRLFLGSTGSVASAVTGRPRSICADCSQILRWRARAHMCCCIYPPLSARVSDMATCAVPMRAQMVQRRQPGAPGMKHFRRLATVTNGTRSRGWGPTLGLDEARKRDCLREELTDLLSQPTPVIEPH
jgi:hypothetical protein